jgi:protein-S-isoprenylcysteine O-methyltransferase Ste14
MALVGLVFPAIIAVIIFGAAGRADLPFVWACLGLNGLFWIAAAFVFPPGFMRERFRPGKQGRVRDPHRAIAIPLLIVSWVLTGLDLGRLHWTDTIPPALRIVGLVGYAIAMAATLWAVASNPFYSPVVRLQRDRGQRVIMSGPYRFVRHPGYAATILVFGFSGLALGSWLGMAPLLALVLSFVRRTILEDGMLRRELEGYELYAGRVRRRLVPGIW